ncbi:5'-3' exonuclease [Actinotalea subterranea]|uniref:5'-3' exonuclease n=1 Tax=Actinotalea subterranea TaxID=2607497 RepID=UPI0011EE244A|nr:5'-3' exonuclease H3TH domain-containing protein [Actinotalea subterranea]
MTAPRPLLLLDTASLYFRAFFGVPDSVRAPDGTPVNAIRGLLDMTARLVTARRPERLVACWDDDWRPAFRVDAIPSYKAHRLAADGGEEVPDALATQIPVIVEVLEAFGIARVGAPGFEADDVIGTLTARETARPAGERRPVEIVTGDRDLFQLVDDAAGVRVLYTARGIGDLDTIDEARLAEKYDVRGGSAYADLAVLRGDASDGLPGVAGIGEKTGAALLRRFGDLDGVLRALDAGDASFTPAQRRRLTEALPYLAVAPGVVRVALDAPVAEADDALPRTPAQPDRLVELSTRWGLASSVARLVDALAA